MCLVLDLRKGHGAYVAADRDIVCYKIVINSGNATCISGIKVKQGTLYSPYMLCEITEGEHKLPLKDNLVFMSSHRKCGNRVGSWKKDGNQTMKDITRGFHTYVSKKDAYKSAKWLQKVAFSGSYAIRVHVIKAIIPKGTKYFRGITLENLPSYCSNRIKYVIDKSILI